MTDLPPLDSAVLPAGIRWRFLDGINGLCMHVRGRFRDRRPPVRAAVARFPRARL